MPKIEIKSTKKLLQDWFSVGRKQEIIITPLQKGLGQSRQEFM
jgi:hypothetical protein